MVCEGAKAPYTIAQKVDKEKFVGVYGEPKVSGIQKPALVRATEN